jgi:hypothetical protein
VLTPTRPEAIAETDKVLLVDALKDPENGLLDDFVFQRGNPQWALPTIGLGHPGATGRLSSVGSPVNPIMEVNEVVLQVLLVFMPSHTIDSNGRRLLQIVEGFGQAVLIDMVQQGCECERAVLTGSFAHAVQTT